jgi:hypothetical protein
MTSSAMASASGGGRGGPDRLGLSYRANYRANYRVELCSQNGSRPRQHWVFAHSSSPTTRPPRRRLVGRVRVVGLEVCVVGVLAGAGATQAKQNLGEGKWMEGKTKTEERQLHTQADGGMKAWEGRRGGWDEGLCRLGFGGGEMVR